MQRTILLLPFIQFIAPITSTGNCSQFVLSELPRYTQTQHCLIPHNDGYILNGDLWDPDYLKYDYIGGALAA
ncbi:MAG: hypothetical protein QGI86_14540 [Candidatus Poribacteria bacterium]|nr:hypothetical protein [Candidatus Poribacteria bacterium]MDP6751057.1 hypothetical protein [Candidatus Poribacteria bacterium]MDP6997410.1 hypothetical protein [Candidatus Poribacteria bacterium]